MRDDDAQRVRIDRLLHFNFAISLLILLLLNAIDAFFTIIFVDALGLPEANPIVAPLFIWGPMTFLVWKLLMVVTCCVIIYVAWTKNRKTFLRITR